MTALDTRAQLPAALSELGLALSPQACGRLLGHLDLIAKWNRVYNLTAVRDPAEMWTHHLLDSLAAVAPLAAYWANRCAAMRPEDPGVQSPYGGPHILDVGSGAGLPGVTLAIALPQALAATVGRADAAPPHGPPRAVLGDVPGAMPKAASALGPGVPPDGAGVRVTCVDTVAKKAGFIRQVAAELGLG
ncbi:MAG: 16S rRNA (guanine(527)-N(7))-methyltransferase RsmG, partial [Betaproteobacteria bacterium]